MSRALRQHAGGSDAEVAGRLRVPPGTVVTQQESLAEHEVELAFEDLPVLEAEGEHHDVKQVAYLFQLGALVAFRDVLGQKRVQP